MVPYSWIDFVEFSCECTDYVVACSRIGEVYRADVVSDVLPAEDIANVDVWIIPCAVACKAVLAEIAHSLLRAIAFDVESGDAFTETREGELKRYEFG